MIMNLLLVNPPSVIETRPYINRMGIICTIYVTARPRLIPALGVNSPKYDFSQTQLLPTLLAKERALPHYLMKLLD